MDIGQDLISCPMIPLSIAQWDYKIFRHRPLISLWVLNFICTNVTTVFFALIVDDASFLHQGIGWHYPQSTDSASSGGNSNGG